MTTALVTGANGFIGSHLIEALQDRGDSAFAMVRKTSNTDNLADRTVDFRYGSLGDADALAEAMAGVEVVFHVAGRTAAYSQAELDAANGEGTANVMAAAKRAGVRRVVLVSSLEGAGASSHELARAEHHAPDPFTRYGRSKLAGEQAAWAARDNAEVVIVRPPLVYGPRDVDVLQMIQSSNNRVVARPGWTDGHMSAVHVADLVRGILLAADQGKTLPRGEVEHVLSGAGADYTEAGDASDPRGQGIYFFEDGGQHSIKSFGHDAARLLGKSAITLPIPWSIAMASGWGNELLFKMLGKSCPAYNSDKAAASFSEGWWCSSARARAELGYEPEYPLERGLEHTIAWLRDRKIL